MQAHTAVQILGSCKLKRLLKPYFSSNQIKKTNGDMKVVTPNIFCKTHYNLKNFLIPLSYTLNHRTHLFDSRNRPLESLRYTLSHWWLYQVLWGIPWGTEVYLESLRYTLSHWWFYQVLWGIPWFTEVYLESLMALPSTLRYTLSHWGIPWVTNDSTKYSKVYLESMRYWGEPYMYP